MLEFSGLTEHQTPSSKGLSRATIAVVLTWVKIKNAEYEVVQRFRHACNFIGVNMLIIDNDGYKIWSSLEGELTPGTRITREDCSFVISLHFESPRLYDVFSYTALWNPPEFYVGPGYERTVSQLASHDAVLSCHSDIADIHARNIFAGFGRPLEGALPALFHSVPSPYLSPSVTEFSRLFYIGINWERISGERGRHHDLLELLDADDLIDIYGPKVFLNAEPWRGFKCYRDEIPFDGLSVVSRIHDSGICLALSSSSHQRCGIMSNRFFEGLAAGAVIIANRNPFIDRYFSDCVYIIDDTQPPDVLANKIRDLVLTIRQDPAAARELALAGQRRFMEMFTLQQCLADILSQHEQRERDYNEKTLGVEKHEITVLLEYTGQELSVLFDMIANVGDQQNCVIDLAIICDKHLEGLFAGSAAESGSSFARSVRIYSESLRLTGDETNIDPMRDKGSGQAITSALAEIKTPFFCFMQPDDQWFSDHLASLAMALTASPESGFSCSGKINEDKDSDGLSKRLFAQLQFDRFSDLLHCALPREVGRFLYRASVLDILSNPVMQLLDGFHNRFFNVAALLHGLPAQTCRATYVHLRWQMHLIETVYTEVEQAQFVMDCFRGNLRWLERAAQFPNTPVTTQSALTKVLIARPDTLYRLSKEGEGLPLIRSGFSEPEPEATWIDGKTAQLEFIVDKPVRDHDVVLFAAGRKSDSGMSQTVTVSINGQAGETLQVDDDLTELRYPIPTDVKDTSPKISVLLTLAHAEQVRDTNGKVTDSRYLGLRLASAGIFAKKFETQTDLTRDSLASLAKVLIAHPDTLYTLSKEGEGLPLIRSGFSEPEPESTWIDGKTAQLEFIVDEPVRGHDVVLFAAGRKSDSGMSQTVTVSINGQAGETLQVDDDLTELRYPIPTDVKDTSPKISVLLTLAHAEQVRDTNGKVTDSRYLGLRLASAGIFAKKFETQTDLRPDSVASIDRPLDSLAASDSQTFEMAENLVPMASVRSVIAAIPGVRRAKQLLARKLNGMY